MKTIILAGGLGTRISEETADKPKPMVTLDSKPMLWHIMNIYAKQGIVEVIIAAGYKSASIAKWVEESDLPWKVYVVDTGENTQTGGRLKRILALFKDETFFATYGDGLANVNLANLQEIHNSNKAIVTVTAVRPPARFGVLKVDGHLVTRFGEKSQADEGWINGGFFMLKREVSSLISGDDEPFETGALMRLVESGGLYCYKHLGFWKPMDTLRERMELQALIRDGDPPWLELDSQ